MIELLAQPAFWTGLFTLTILEIVLGIDNIVFVSILAGKLPQQDREKARKLGMSLAILLRIFMLFGVGLLVKAKAPVFDLPFIGNFLNGGLDAKHREEILGVSIKDMVMLFGGLFLIYKSVKEIHHKLEGSDENVSAGAAKSQFVGVILSMMWINVIFSIDSVITAVGMSSLLEVMILSVVISGLFMLFYSRLVAEFVDKHPTIKILALAFLVLIGGNLVAESFGVEIPKGYTYFAMAFAVIVEIVNIKLAKKSEPVELHEAHLAD